MILSAIHSRISEILNKGSMLDTQIVSEVALSALWLERNYSYNYMERYVSFVTDITVAYPRALSLPTRLKSIGFIRYTNDDGEYIHLKRIRPDDVTKVETGSPTAYWLDGYDYIWLDNTPDKEYSMEMKCVSLTSWPADTSAEPWLAIYAPDVLIGKTVLSLSPWLRDEELIAYYKAKFEEDLRTLQLFDEELKYVGPGESMVYEGDPYD